MTIQPGTMPPRLKAVGPDPDEHQREFVLAAGEISLVLIVVIAVAVAWAFPFKAVKFGLIGFFAVAMLAQTMRRPALGLALLAFSVPAMDLVPKDLFAVPAMNAETILTLVAIVVWIRSNQLYGKDEFGTPLGRVLLIYALFILLSSIRSWMLWRTSLFDILAAAKNHLSFMIFLPVAFHSLRSRRDQMLVVLACSLSLLLNCFQGINNSWLAFLTGTLERRRAVGLLALQPNTFGGALAMYLPLFLMLGLNAVGGKRLRLWFLALSGVTGFTLLLTLSRGAWIGAVVGVAVTLLFRNRIVLVLMVLAMFGYQYWLPDQALQRIEVTTNIDEDSISEDAILEDSAQMRVEQYKSLPGMMEAHPIMGWGYKSFPQVFEKHGTLGRAKGAHSSYVQLATEGGVVGLGLLCLVMFAAAWAGVRAARLADADPLHRWLGVGVLGGAVSMALCMATGARFEPQKIFAWFWIFAGIAEREGILHQIEMARRSIPLSVVERLKRHPS